jgi:integrase
MVYQKGTVFLQGAREKKWYGKFRVYLCDRDGKEVEKTRKVVLGPKAKLRKWEAEERLQEVIRLENGNPGSNSVPVFDDSVTVGWFVAERYLPMRRGRWRAATQKNTEYEIKKYLLSFLGDLPLRKAGTFELQVLLNRLAKDYSDSVVRHAYVNLKAIFRTARKMKFISENPAEDVAMPETKPVDRPVLAATQIADLINAIDDPRDLCLLCIGIFCGTRASEVFGLQWKSWQEDKLVPYGTVFEGQFFPGKLKTLQSRESMPVPEHIRPMIEAWKEICPDTSPDALMFPTFGRKSRIGQDVPQCSKNFLRWRVFPIAERLGIPRRLMTFQVMRRTLGTDLQQFGSMKDAQRILRHADIKTTGNVYVQAIPESVMGAINRRTASIFESSGKARNATVPNGSKLSFGGSASD